MFKVLRTFFRYHRQIFVVSSLILSTAICLGLLVMRVARANNLGYVMLVWNLALAWIPFVCSLAAYNLYKTHNRLRWVAIAICAVVWLLFFPNAPYILTDLIHLRAWPGIPLWYDALLIASFAWAGCFLGLVSLYLMQMLVARSLGLITGWCFVLIVTALSGFGIYLGRFLRWNSWDIFLAPKALLLDIWLQIRHPMAHLETFVFSALFSAFFLAAYLMLIAVIQFRQESHKIS